MTTIEISSSSDINDAIAYLEMLISSLKPMAHASDEKMVDHFYGCGAFIAFPSDIFESEVIQPETDACSDSGEIMFTTKTKKLEVDFKFVFKQKTLV
jgi:hypothetical protein